MKETTLVFCSVKVLCLFCGCDLAANPLVPRFEYAAGDTECSCSCDRKKRGKKARHAKDCQVNQCAQRMRDAGKWSRGVR